MSKGGLPSTRHEDESKRKAEIQVIIAQVENLKQIHLSDEESVALATALSRTGKSVAEIREMGIRVAMNPDYGRISYDLWLNATRLYTGEEVAQIVDQRLQDSEWLSRHLHVDKEEAKRIAERDARSEYYAQLDIAVQKERDCLRREAIEAGAWFLQQSETVRDEIFDIAVKEQLIDDDRFTRKYKTSAYIMGLIVEAIKEYRNRMPPTQKEKEG
jgi:hypothetical protein